MTDDEQTVLTVTAKLTGKFQVGQRVQGHIPDGPYNYFHDKKGTVVRVDGPSIFVMLDGKSHEMQWHQDNLIAKT